MWTFVWCMTVLFNGHDGLEPTDRLVPANWKGNPWGPEATKARATGEIPPITMSPLMKEWDRWGTQVLRNGDIVFRRADARVLFGRFPFSRFTANVSGSKFSHTGIVTIVDGKPEVYDTTKSGVRRQPFAVWVLDNVGPLGVKRLRPDLKDHAAKAVKFCEEAFEKQVPFDFDLGLDDSAFYCVEMTEKAYRASGLPLSEPVKLGDMENASKFPVCMFAFAKLSKLTLDQAVFFPGNDRHGIWSSPSLVTVYPPASASSSSSSAANGAGARPKPKRPATGSKTATRRTANPS